ncbi:MAG: ABC transporter ATP-binding protein [Planctomycetota bacterium JB042]
MIEVDQLVKRFGDVVAVGGISFRVDEGEVVGFLGPNGAGKSTTLKILTAYQPATSGSVRIAGLDVLTRSLEVRERLGYLPENVPVYPDMRVEEYLRFRALLKGVGRKEVRTAVDSALDRCGCREMRRRMIGKLSKGYRQRVGLADAIVHDPPILILDEPTSGLDPNQRVEVRKLIASLGEDKTVLLSSHILAEVEAVAERVVIVRKGEIVADGRPRELVEGAGGGRHVTVEADGEGASVEAALRSVPGVSELAAVDAGDGWRRYELAFGEVGDHRLLVAEAVARAGGRVRELTSATPTLEDLFRRLTVEEAAA